MKGFVFAGKAKDVFAVLQALAELEWEVVDLCSLLDGQCISLE